MNEGIKLGWAALWLVSEVTSRVMDKFLIFPPTYPGNPMSVIRKQAQLALGVEEVIE